MSPKSWSSTLGWAHQLREAEESFRCGSFRTLSFRVGERYQLSIWDSLIVATALLSDCETLYSEDLQGGQVFGERLKIVNPFK